MSTRLAVRACASLSSWLPAAIACCSERAAVVHKARGYRAARFEVIPNGYGLGQFFPDAIAGAQVRAQWGIEPNEPLIGMVARWDAQKRHANLLAALAMLRDRVPKCALIGPGMESSNLELMRLIRSRELGTRVVLAGTRNDIPAVMNALDVHVLPSASEAFPNVVGEAMACGTPCVVTDVGDAALIVGETGWVVPPDNIPALARGIHRALTSIRLNGKQNLGTICRKRIETHFSLARMVASYTALWAKVVTRARPGPFAISDQEA